MTGSGPSEAVSWEMAKETGPDPKAQAGVAVLREVSPGEFLYFRPYLQLLFGSAASCLRFTEQGIHSVPEFTKIQ